MQAHVLIPMDVDIFWTKMREIVEQVINEKQPFQQQPDAKPQLLKVKEVCSLFQISKPTIYDWIRKGQLRSVKIESRRFFLIDDIRMLINNGSSIVRQPK